MGTARRLPAYHRRPASVDLNGEREKELNVMRYIQKYITWYPVKITWPAPGTQIPMLTVPKHFNCVI